MAARQSRLRSPSQWADYIRAAQGESVAAIIEVGVRLTAAHADYLRAPQQWGRRWDVWCKEALHLSQPSVSLYESIAANLITIGNNILPRLPPSWRTLHLLARVRAADAALFDAALADGRINPQTTREQAEELLDEINRRGRRARESADAGSEAVLRQSGVGWQIDHGDFRQWRVQPGSVDLVLTDPPYGLDYLDLYRDLPGMADQWLAVDGWCAVLIGQTGLPEIVQALASGPLHYAWVVAFTAASRTANGIQSLKIQNTWKPVVLLRKNPRSRLREWTNDCISFEWEGNREQHIHRWQQEVSPFQKVIRALTKPDALIADPFCGSGTTGIAALLSARRFIGCEQDRRAVADAIRRLNGETGNVVQLNQGLPQAR